MDDQHVAPGAIQPRQDDNLGTDLQVTKGLGEPGVEDQPGIWRSFVSLLWRGGPIDERGLDPTDRLQLVPLIAQGILPPLFRLA